MKDLLTSPQLLSCCVCLITFPSGYKNKQPPDTASFHSLHLSANQCDGLHVTKPRCPLHFPPNCTSRPFTTRSKTITITFQATKLSQNSQTSGCILGMPRKLLLWLRGQSWWARMWDSFSIYHGSGYDRYMPTLSEGSTAQDSWE